MRDMKSGSNYTKKGLSFIDSKKGEKMENVAVTALGLFFGVCVIVTFVVILVFTKKNNQRNQRLYSKKIKDEIKQNKINRRY
jgi:hypothetical protein